MMADTAFGGCPIAARSAEITIDLKIALQKAISDPAALQSALDAVRAALGQ